MGLIFSLFFFFSFFFFFFFLGGGGGSGACCRNFTVFQKTFVSLTYTVLVVISSCFFLDRGGLPHALRGVSFSTTAGEKVGTIIYWLLQDRQRYLLSCRFSLRFFFCFYLYSLVLLVARVLASPVSFKCCFAWSTATKEPCYLMAST